MAKIKFAVEGMDQLKKSIKKLGMFLKSMLLHRQRRA